jgi:lysophospholipase L1-like esterase
MWEDLGAVSAYAIVKEKGYTGTEEEFARMLINAEKIPELMEDVDYLKRNCTGGAGSSGGSGTGSNGKDGVGILEVKQTTTSTEDGGTNIVTVTKTNGEKSTFQVRNGSKGSTGKTPNITIGTVNTLESGQSATASITGTTENPVLNLGIPKGANGSGTSSGTVDTSKTFMTGLHVYSTEVLADLDNMEDNRAYLISCHGVKNVPVDAGGMACSVGFSNKCVVHIYTCLEDSRTFIRTKNGAAFGSWKELQNNESSNVEVTESPYKGKTIVAFGDSIIAGWGWKEGTGVVQPLKEKYPDATWINKAESGANFATTSNPEHTPIVTQIRSYTGAADAIIFDGGVNDINSSIPVGSIESGYDASYNTGTFCGALESALQYIMDTYPLTVKLYIIPHSFAKDNSYVDSIYSKAIEICEKWNMPYLDMRKYAQIAMTKLNKNKYTYNPNSKKGDGVHPNEQFYRTHYCPVIDKTLQNLGIAYGLASDIPDIVKVTGVTLNHNAITLEVGESVQLVATVLPSYATNQNVTWSVNNSNVIVENGKIIGKEIGHSVVTVTTLDGNYTAQCSVTINKKSITENHIEITSLSLDGNCYFDTEILPDQNTNTEVSLYVNTGTTYICGARDDKYKYGYTCTDNFYAIRGTIDSAAKPSAFWGGNWTIKQNGTTFNFGSSSVDTDSIDSFSLTSPLYVGNMSKNGTNAGVGLKGKIYYAKIYQEDVLVADLIPVKKDNGVLCLYDKVRDKYLYNKGSGNLT